MQPTDANLVERAREGETDAFEQLVRRHFRAAYAVALAVVREPADAEDVCQDALITALERLDDCRRPDRFAAWLLQIVRNRARNLLRSQKVRHSLPLDAAGRLAARDGPARDADRAELKGRLLDAMTELTGVQREVLLLHDLHGWRHREIADALEIPEGTARAHLFHARRTLRARLGAELLEEI